MKNKGTKRLETQRLILREFVLEDSRDLHYNLLSDVKTNEFLSSQVHKNEEETLEVLNKWIASYKNPNVYNWAIVLKSTNELIGNIKLSGTNDNKNVNEIGFCYGSKFWNKGYATEALQVVLDYLLEEIGYSLIEAWHTSDNPYSGNVMKKVGMKKEAVLRQRKTNKRTQEISNYIIYSITKEELKNNQVEKYKYKLTKQVNEFIANANISEVSIGCSDSQVIKIEKGDEAFYLKMASLGSLTKEYEKLKWLKEKTKVPEVILYEVQDNVEYLITKSLPGEMLCSSYYRNKDNWEHGIVAVVEALKELYELNIESCPFNVSLEYKLSLVKNNIINNYEKLKISDHVLEKYGSLEKIYQYLIDNKIEEELCFSHGDLSLPNIFADNHKFSGFIDLAECGIADRWFDIAIVVKSIRRNYGEEAVNLLFEKLDILRDDKKIEYYLLLMELYL